jgi:hypothetical protein
MTKVLIAKIESLGFAVIIVECRALSIKVNVSLNKNRRNVLLVFTET